MPHIDIKIERTTPKPKTLIVCPFEFNEEPPGLADPMREFALACEVTNDDAVDFVRLWTVGWRAKSIMERVILRCYHWIEGEDGAKWRRRAPQGMCDLPLKAWPVLSWFMEHHIKSVERPGTAWKFQPLTGVEPADPRLDGNGHLPDCTNGTATIEPGGFCAWCLAVGPPLPIKGDDVLRPDIETDAYGSDD